MAVDYISISIVDDKGDVGNVLVFIPTGHTVAEVQSYANSFIIALDDIIGGIVQSASVNQALTLPGGIKATAVAGENMQKGANFGYDAANTEYRHTQRLGSILEARIVGDEVDEAHADVVAYTALMTSGNGVVFPTDRYGNDLTGLIGNQVTFRKS